MKARFNRQEVADALAAVCAVAASRTPKEILKCVRIEVKPDVILFSATDLELSLRCAVAQVEVDEPGDILVVADTFARIVRECTDEVLTLESKGNELHIRGTGSHFQIVTQDTADFPPIPLLEGEPDYTIATALLRRLIEWTAFASARENTRYAINGLLWEIEDGKLSLVATDGRRLSWARGELTGAGEKAVQPVIVPVKALTLFNRLAIDAEVAVGIKATSNQLLLQAGGATISTALVEGRFPNYRDVVPSDCDRVAGLNTADFHSALKRAALLTNDESKGVKLSFAEGELTLSSRAPEQGESTISVPVQFGGEPVEIGFNPVFLLDVLRVAHTEELAFAMKDANRPGVVRIGEDFVYVVMPVSLASA